MKNCKDICKLCNNLVISTSVEFDSTSNTLNITIPNNNYRKCQKVCIVIAQSIPASTTRTALVNIVVSNNNFPLLKRGCRQVVASEISTRTRYTTYIITSTSTAAFKIGGSIIPSNPTDLEALPIVQIEEGSN